MFTRRADRQARECVAIPFELGICRLDLLRNAIKPESR
jgi:hypothetical protein